MTDEEAVDQMLAWGAPKPPPASAPPPPAEPTYRPYETAPPAPAPAPPPAQAAPAPLRYPEHQMVGGVPIEQAPPAPTPHPQWSPQLTRYEDGSAGVGNDPTAAQPWIGTDWMTGPLDQPPDPRQERPMSTPTMRDLLAGLWGGLEQEPAPTQPRRSTMVGS